MSEPTVVTPTPEAPAARAPGSFAEQCELTTFNSKTGNTTYDKFGVNNPDECTTRGRASAIFNPAVTAITISSKVGGPHNDVSSMSFREPGRQENGQPNPVTTAVVDQRKNDIYAFDPMK